MAVDKGEAWAFAGRIMTMGDALSYRLRRAQHAVLQDFVETFARLDLRPTDFAALLLIAGHPGLKQSEVAEALGIQRANFVAVIDGLERRRLAERRREGSDRRVQALFVTDAGQALLDQLIPVWRAHEERLVARLGGPAARDQLDLLLERLYDAPAA